MQADRFGKHAFLRVTFTKLLMDVNYVGKVNNVISQAVEIVTIILVLIGVAKSYLNLRSLFRNHIGTSFEAAKTSQRVFQFRKKTIPSYLTSLWSNFSNYLLIETAIRCFIDFEVLTSVKYI